MQARIMVKIVVLTLWHASAWAQPSKATKPRKAIICLTYDDGLDTQLTTALPQLDSAGLKATFFLNAIAGSSPTEVIGEPPAAVVGWRAAAAHGHELANHTLFHPCPEKLGWTKTVAIETYTVPRILEEIRTQNALLALLDPARRARAFAYPCNNTLIGSVDYLPSVQRSGLVKFGRGGGDRTSIVTNFATLNPMQVPSWLVEPGTTLPELIAFAEKTKQAHGMGVYQFHGVGGQIFKVSSNVHREFLAYLKAHEAEYSVLTFSAAMAVVTQK
ncbi:polysaccharide deacetylase family protein [Hymenobacter armeniacus]|uniref:Polysaccharide deacetylase family protein n=1 Tax=Hymenobacter armeniacus TaxID=2771358 RepID=A0ABR8JN93_9BACT|nr:polysaccharide deacetylase family protein [Hymenobacter armeniacus]MBD2720732.1 polysaccharide deacetylase family protein [Hymenobacter armeniacus]